MEYKRLKIAAATIGMLIYCAISIQPVNAQAVPEAQANDNKLNTSNEKTSQEPAKANPTTDAKATDKLALEEQLIAEKYKHLEEIMLQMAEISAQSDPNRAALLKKALAQSKDQLIGVRFERLVEFLEKDQLSQAMEKQTDLDQQLRSLLEILLSENRTKRIQSEKARIREYLKRLGNILKQEKDVQARTIDRDDPNRLAGEQGKIADKTGGLAKDIQAGEEGLMPKADGEEKKGEGGGRKAGSEEKNMKGNQGENQDQKGEQAQPSDNQQANPARVRLETAKKRMEDAQKKLEKAQQDGAAKDQEEAIKELEQAKAELEQILRQLREEEVNRVLAMLEARFRKMLEMQREVYEGTVGLDKIPSAQRNHNHEIESSRLSGKEMQIVAETDKALLLLHEDGTAVALPEAVDQMRADMQQVVERLAQAKVGQITQGIELDIIAALEEMIDALKKAQKDLEKNRRKPGMPTEAEDSPLVDKLAELKMIRALQMRINSRTERYTKLIEGEQAENVELIDALKRLAERQERVYRVTHDLSSGKTE